MSEYTTCNYCELESLKQRAKRDKKKLKRAPNKEHGGINITIDGKFACWFMELTNHCVC